MSALATSACFKHSNQMTLQNASGETVVCQAPQSAPELSEFGRTAIVSWCGLACEAHGFKWIGQTWEQPVWIADLDLGKRERSAAEKYLPTQCTPFNPPPMGIYRSSDGGVPDCMGVLFKDGKCPN